MEAASGGQATGGRRVDAVLLLVAVLLLISVVFASPAGADHDSDEDDNVAPLVRDDDEITNSGVAVEVELLDNDEDADGTLDLTSLTVMPAGNGSVTVDTDAGTAVYVSEPGFGGTDAFGYTVCDDGGSCGSATVTIWVNLGPEVEPDAAKTLTGQAVRIDVLANDSDPERGPLGSLSIPSPPAGGTIDIEPDGSITYRPGDGFFGVDSFTYSVCDGEGACAGAPVEVSVDGRPVAVDDTAEATAGETIEIDLLGNDIDPEGDLDPVRVAVVEGGSATGRVAIDRSTGVATYTAANDFEGEDRFFYVACDSHSQCDFGEAIVAVAAAVSISTPDPEPSSGAAAPEPAEPDAPTSPVVTTAAPQAPSRSPAAPAEAPVTTVAEATPSFETIAPLSAGAAARADDAIDAILGWVPEPHSDPTNTAPAPTRVPSDTPPAAAAPEAGPVAAAQPPVDGSADDQPRSPLLTGALVAIATLSVGGAVWFLRPQPAPG